MPCRRRGCTEVRAISGEKRALKSSTLNVGGSGRPRRRRVGCGTTRCPWAGLTSCYCADGRRWILLARPGSGRHTGHGMENVAVSSDRWGETGPMQPAQMPAGAAWRSRRAWSAARSGRRRGPWIEKAAGLPGWPGEPDGSGRCGAVVRPWSDWAGMLPPTLNSSSCYGKSIWMDMAAPSRRPFRRRPSPIAYPSASRWRSAHTALAWGCGAIPSVIRA